LLLLLMVRMGMGMAVKTKVMLIEGMVGASFQRFGMLLGEAGRMIGL
jgi:hypothetical protein